MIGALEKNKDKNQQGIDYWSEKGKALFTINWLTSTKLSANNSQAASYSDVTDAFYNANGWGDVPLKNASMLLNSKSTKAMPMSKVLGKDWPDTMMYAPQKFEGTFMAEGMYFYGDFPNCPEYIALCVSARLDKKMTDLHNEYRTAVPPTPQPPGCSFGTPQQFDPEGPCEDCDLQSGPQYKPTALND